MRRSAIGATVVAAVLISSMAGPALARPADIVPGMFDQGVAGTSMDYYWSSSSSLTQTITPSHSGILTHVAMDCVADGMAMPVVLRIGTSYAAGFCSTGAFYTDFIFSAPLPTVVAGTPFTMSIDTGGFGIGFLYSLVPYAGGGASEDGAPIQVGEPAVTLTSFAFMSYVLEPPTTTYAWNPTSVVAGQTTTATLTATTVFPQTYAELNVVKAARPNVSTQPFPFTLKLAALPAWFTPTGIVCDPAITNCTIADFSAGLNGTLDALVQTTMVVTLTGTAAPPSNATGSSGQTSGQGCNTWTIGEDTMSACGTGQAVLGIVAPPTPSPAPTQAAPAATPTPAPTMPPTNLTASDSSAGGPSPWFLLWALPALLAGLGVVIRRGEARDRA